MTADAIVEDFVDEVVLTGLTYPTNVEFAPNGKVFVTEKSGKIKVFDSLSDPTADVFADLSAQVHDFWDRGMLGLAIHPNFPATPYVYVLYTYDAKPGGAHPTWGDGCSSPPGPTDMGCVVTGRLSRLTASGNSMVPESELVMIQDWCQQYPSHSIGDIEFGADGALYATGGDGASFSWVDFGNGPGTTTYPRNPCADPPGAIGSTLTAPTAEGGALRSQDLRTTGDPVTLDGTVIRVDPLTGEALPTNPGFASNTDPNGKRIVAYGLRNPFRFVVKPGTNQLFIGDVGWNLWEEVNHHPNPTAAVRNFGWPCYEGGSGTSIKQAGYDTANLNICENLYTSPAGTVSAPLFAYHHEADITGSDPCPPANPPQGTSSSISGLAFYSAGGYPGTYNGALFGSDYSRNCIWVIFPNSSGTPNPSTVQVFQHLAAQPVDLEAGPGGDIFYASFNQTGSIHRIRFIGDNNPPTAVIGANPTSGSAPLLVNFTSTGSSDPDSDALTFTWDLDNDGAYDDATGPTTQWTYTTPGTQTAKLKATDARGESDTDTISVSVSNSAPTPVIDTPAGTLKWSVGQTVAFSGHATDPDQGSLPASALNWVLIMHHCAEDGSCHTHPVQTFTGVASGSFVAPDHEYPSWLELQLTATDQFGSAVSVSRELDPLTSEVTVQTDPTGLIVTLGGVEAVTPLTKTYIVNSSLTIGADSQEVDGEEWLFQSWSDGGDASHTIAVPATDTVYTASFAPPAPLRCDFDDDGFADLAAGTEAGGKVIGAGSVEVRYGSVAGPAVDPDQVWNQDSAGVLGEARKGDRFGAALACGDFNGDGYQDLAIGVPGKDFAGKKDAGTIAVLYGSEAGLSANGDQSLRRGSSVTPHWLVTLAGKALKGDSVGESLTAADFNGDGRDDLAVGAPADNVTGITDAGSVNVAYGSTQGVVGPGRVFHRNNKGVTGKLSTSGRFGGSLTVGDFDGDGFADLAVGVPGANTAGVDGSGAVNVLFGRTTGVGTVGNRLLSSATAGIPGEPAAGNGFGLALTSGDLDGNGFADLAIALSETVAGKTGAGAIVVVPGAEAGLDTGTASMIHRGLAAVMGTPGKNDRLGAALSSADFDGDGFDDLAASAPGDRHHGFNGAGSVNVIYGSAGGPDLTRNEIWLPGEAGIPGQPRLQLGFGGALTAADWSGDGYAGLAVTSAGEVGPVPSGTITLVPGSTAGLAGSAATSRGSTRVVSLPR